MSPHQQRQLASDAIIAAVGRGWISDGVIAVAQALADCLIGHSSLDRLLEWLLPKSERLSIVGLVRALQREDAAHCDQILDGLFGHSTSADAQLIVLLARPNGTERDDLLHRGVDLLLSQHSEPRDRLALAAAIRRLNHDSLVASLVIERSAQFQESRDTAIFWLLAELLVTARFPSIKERRYWVYCMRCFASHAAPM